MSRVRDEDYGRLLGFRTELRRFLRWSEDEARAAGLTPAQHQLLLAVRGHRGATGPTIGEQAIERLSRVHLEELRRLAPLLSSLEAGR